MGSRPCDVRQTKARIVYVAAVWEARNTDDWDTLLSDRRYCINALPILRNYLYVSAEIRSCRSSKAWTLVFLYESTTKGCFKNIYRRLLGVQARC